MINKVNPITEVDDINVDALEEGDFNPLLANVLTETIYVLFGLDEFSTKTVCVTSQNSPVDDWKSFPVKRSQKFSKKFANKS